MKRIMKALLKKLFHPVVRRYRRITKELDKLDYIINKLSLADEIVELKGARFWVPNAPRDLIQNIQLSQASFFELDLLREIDKLLNENSVVLDIGANVGNHTVYWGNITKVKKIYSFEPVKTTFAILSKNIEINHLNGKVKLYNIGLSDIKTRGTVEAHHANNIGGTMLRKAEDGSIELDKLDNIAEIINEPAIDFVKIDVEGMEKGVLTGAARFFNRHKPAVFIESVQGVNHYDFTRKFFKDLDYDDPIKYHSENYLFVYNKGISKN
jgi:FkbM family methyltransferase